MNELSYSLQVFIFTSKETQFITGDQVPPFLNSLFFHSFKEILAHLHLGPDLIISDQPFPIEVLEEISTHCPYSFLVLIADSLHARQLIEFERNKMGKSILSEELNREWFLHFANHRIQVSDVSESKQNKIELTDTYKKLGLYGSGKNMKKLFRNLENASKGDQPIFLLSEIGCEQELCGKIIHSRSKRKNSPYVYVHLQSIPQTLLEQELFGREKDIKTAQQRTTGWIEQASGGTLFLDGIEYCSLELQQKLYRAQKEKKYLKPGGNNVVFWNIRLVLSSSHDLEELKNKASILPDLYFYLKSNSFSIPPLRKRSQDIITLAQFILREFLKRNYLKNIIFTQQAKDALLQYNYPGNLIELKSLVEAAATICPDTDIKKEHLLFQHYTFVEPILNEDKTLEEYNRFIILHTLKKNNQDVIETSKKLKIGKSTIYRMLKDLKTQKTPEDED